MREIRFRGLHKTTKTWCFGSLDLTDEAGPRIRTDDPELYWSSRFVIPDSVGQYIEKKDKKGVEIYCGDLVRVETEVNAAEFMEPDNFILCSIICEVFYCKAYCNFDLRKISGDKELGGWGFYGDEEEGLSLSLEVIGNIHENPELLK